MPAPRADAQLAGAAEKKVQPEIPRQRRQRQREKQINPFSPHGKPTLVRTGRNNFGRIPSYRPAARSGWTKNRALSPFIVHDAAPAFKRQPGENPCDPERKRQ